MAPVGKFEVDLHDDFLTTSLERSFDLTRHVIHYLQTLHRLAFVYPIGLVSTFLNPHSMLIESSL
jgi:hypothetical protein